MILCSSFSAHSAVSVRDKTLAPPPMLGEHTEEILDTLLGYDKTRMDRLRQEKVIA